MEEEVIKKSCRYNKKCIEYKDENGVMTKHVCNAYMEVAGFNPVTNETVNRRECVDTLTPLLLIEQTQQLMLLTNSIQELRKDADVHNKVMLLMADNKGIKEINPRMING